MITVKLNGPWKLYWGGAPLPAGAEALGTVTRNQTDTGALIRLQSGIFMQGNALSVRSLPQREVEEALSRSQAAASLGSKTSEAKTAAARKNGQLGGRPRKSN